MALDAKAVADPSALEIAVLRCARGRAVRLTVVRAGGTRATVRLVLGVQPTTAPATTAGCG